jgi:hypothetical protein
MFLAPTNDRFLPTLPTPFTTFLTSKKHLQPIALSNAPFKRTARVKKSEILTAEILSEKTLPQGLLRRNRLGK